jgi:hypothetical protein
LEGKSGPGAIRLTTEQALYLRMRGQGLLPGRSRVGGADAAPEVTRFTGGLQAQDLFAATLGVRVRAAGSTLADFERSRLVERSVVWSWFMRGTLHLVPAEDFDWLLGVLGPPQVAATARRRDELGLHEDTYAKGLAVVLGHLAAVGPATREELGHALAAAGLPSGYSIERHLLFRASLEGHLCFGADRGAAPGAHPTYTLLPEWLGRPLKRLNEGELFAAQVHLARRYLDAFAPASPADFSAWTGINLRDLRTAWDMLKGDLVEVRVEEQVLYLPAARMAELDESVPSPVVRLLPAFDAYLLGHRTRGLIDDGRYAAQYKGGGMLPATVMVDGRLRGTWRTNRKGRQISITVKPFEPFSLAIEAEIKREIADCERFVNGSG